MLRLRAEPDIDHLQCIALLLNQHGVGGHDIITDQSVIRVMMSSS